MIESYYPTLNYRHVNESIFIYPDSKKEVHTYLTLILQMVKEKKGYLF